MCCTDTLNSPENSNNHLTSDRPAGGLRSSCWDPKQAELRFGRGTMSWSWSSVLRRPVSWQYAALSSYQHPPHSQMSERGWTSEPCYVYLQQNHTWTEFTYFSTVTDHKQNITNNLLQITDFLASTCIYFVLQGQGFSLWCCWKVKYCDTWYIVVARVGREVSKDQAVHNCLTLKMKALWPFARSGTSCSATQNHIPADFKLQIALYWCTLWPDHLDFYVNLSYGFNYTWFLPLVRGLLISNVLKEATVFIFKSWGVLEHQESITPLTQQCIINNAAHLIHCGNF